MGGTVVFTGPPPTVMFARAAVMPVAATVMFVAADANPAAVHEGKLGFRKKNRGFCSKTTTFRA